MDVWRDLWAARLSLGHWLAQEKNSADRAEPGGILVVWVCTHGLDTRCLASGRELGWPRWRLRRWPPRRLGPKEGKS